MSAQLAFSCTFPVRSSAAAPPHRPKLPLARLPTTVPPRLVSTPGAPHRLQVKHCSSVAFQASCAEADNPQKVTHQSQVHKSTIARRSCRSTCPKCPPQSKVNTSACTQVAKHHLPATLFPVYRPPGQYYSSAAHSNAQSAKRNRLQSETVCAALVSLLTCQTRTALRNRPYLPALVTHVLYAAPPQQRSTTCTAGCCPTNVELGCACTLPPCSPCKSALPHIQPLPPLGRQSIITINISGGASQPVASARSRLTWLNKSICLLRSGTPAGYALLPTYVVKRDWEHSGSPLVNGPLQPRPFHSSQASPQAIVSWAVPFRVLVSKVYLS